MPAPESRLQVHPWTTDKPPCSTGFRRSFVDRECFSWPSTANYGENVVNSILPPRERICESITLTERCSLVGDLLAVDDGVADGFKTIAKVLKKGRRRPIPFLDKRVGGLSKDRL